MEEELKKGIADCTVRVCSEYEEVVKLLETISPSNSVLQQYLMHVASTLQYAALNFQDASVIDLSACKRSHDPVRLLNEVESRFNVLEQGFYVLYPEVGFRTKIKLSFEATKSDFDKLETYLSKIS